MAVYANRFQIVANDVLVRLVCIDERPPIAEGLPTSSTSVADLAMLPADAIALAEVITRICKK